MSEGGLVLFVDHVSLQANERAPSVILIDDIDVLLPAAMVGFWVSILA